MEGMGEMLVGKIHRVGEIAWVFKIEQLITSIVSFDVIS